MYRVPAEQINTEANDVKKWLDTNLQMPLARLVQPRLPELEADVRSILALHLDPNNQESYRVNHPNAFVRLTHELVADTVGQFSAQAAAEILRGPDGDKILDYAFENRDHIYWGEDGKRAPKRPSETFLCVTGGSARNARQGWGRIVKAARGAAKRFGDRELVKNNPGLVRGPANRHDKEEGYTFRTLTATKDDGALTHDSNVADTVTDRLVLVDDAFRRPSKNRITLTVPPYPYDDPNHLIDTETLTCPVERVREMGFYWHLGVLTVAEIEPDLFTHRTG